MQDEPNAPGTDYETGLPDSVGWNAVLEAEALRVRRHGGSHGLVAVRVTASLDGGSAHRVAHAVAAAVRDIDLLARIDPATFGVLALHCEDLTALVNRIHAALEGAGMAAGTRVDARPAGPELPADWAALVAGPGATPARRHVDFVVRSGFSLN